MISLSLMQRFQQDSQPSHLFLASPFFSLVFHSLNTLFLASRFLLWLQNVSLLLLLKKSGWCDLFIVYKGFCLLVTSVDQPVRLSFQETHRVEGLLWEPGVCPHFWFQMVFWEAWVVSRCSRGTWWHSLYRKSLNTRLYFLEVPEIRICPYVTDASGFFCKTSFSSPTINSKQVLKGCPDRWEGLGFQLELVVTGWEEHFVYRTCA